MEEEYKHNILEFIKPECKEAFDCMFPQYKARNYVTTLHPMFTIAGITMANPHIEEYFDIGKMNYANPFDSPIIGVRRNEKY